MPGNLEQTVRTLAAKAASLRRRSINEQNTKAVLIEPMLEALGWDLRDLRTVQQQFRATNSDTFADYALHLGGRPVMTIEAKALGKDLAAWAPIEQALRYAFDAGASVCVLTDGDMYHLYNAIAPLPAPEKVVRKPPADRSQRSAEHGQPFAAAGAFEL